MATLFILLAIALGNSPTVRAGDGPPPSNGPGQLRVMVPLDASASFDHALTEVVRQFNASQSKFQVELSHRGGTFQNLRAIIAAHYANDLPDLALVNEADLPTLNALNIVQPFPEKWFSSKKLIPNLLSPLKCKGEHCSLPFQRRVAVWFFNRELLFKLNQETDKIPTSWQKLAPMTLRLQKPNELWGAALPASGDAAIARWTALGLPPLNRSTTLPAETTVEWVTRMWNIRASWVPGSPNSDEATRRFMEQRAVILLGALDQWGYLKTNAPFKFGVSLPEGELPWFGTDFVLLGKGPALDWAREFLDYLYSPDVALTLFRAAITLPVSRVHIDSPVWKNEIEHWPLLKTAMSRKLKQCGLDRIAPNIREEWANAVWQSIEQNVEIGQRSLKATELKSTLQKILSTNSH